MNDDPGALPAKMGLDGEPGAAIHGQAQLEPPSGGGPGGARGSSPLGRSSRPPPACRGRSRTYDLLGGVCSGLPFLAPLGCRRPVLCWVNSRHPGLWSIRFRPPASTVGRNIERVVMPWAHRGNLFLTVSA